MDEVGQAAGQSFEPAALGPLARTIYRGTHCVLADPGGRPGRWVLRSGSGR